MIKGVTKLVTPQDPFYLTVLDKGYSLNWILNIKTANKQDILLAVFWLNLINIRKTKQTVVNGN